MTRWSFASFGFLACLCACTSQGLSSRAPGAGGAAGAGGVGTGGAGAPAGGGAPGSGGLPVTVTDAAPPTDGANADGAGGTADAISPDARVIGDVGGGMTWLDASPPDVVSTLTDASTGVLVSSVTTVDFGTVALGTTMSMGVSITNVGATTTVKVETVGADVRASICTVALLPGASCTMAIMVTPTVAGPFAGIVLATPTGGAPLQITVKGVAVASVATFVVSPSSIALGDVLVGTPVMMSVKVTAVGPISRLTVDITGADLNLDTAGSTCTQTLAAGSSCVISAVFMTAISGTPIGNSIVISQGGVTRSVPVTANVVTPAKLAVTPSTADLAATPGQSSIAIDINVGNMGGTSTGSLAVALGGIDASAFKIVEDSCSAVILAPTKYCTVTVAFAPPLDTASRKTATLTVTDRGPAGSVATATLAGGPTSPPSLVLAGGPALGSVIPGATGAEVLFTITNTSATSTGASTASLTSTLITISSNTCATTASLGQGESCTIGLRLSPGSGTAPQAVSALLTVSAANARSTATAVTGYVVSP